MAGQNIVPDKAKHVFGTTSAWNYVDANAGAYISQFGVGIFQPNKEWKNIKLDDVTHDLKGFDIKELEDSNAGTLADLYKDGMTLYFVRHTPPDETLTHANIQNFGGTRTRTPATKDDGGGTFTVSVLVTSDMWPLKFHVIWQYLKRDPRTGFSHVWDPRKIMAPAFVAYTLSQDLQYVVRTDVYYGVMPSNVPLSALNFDVTATDHPTIDITYTYIQHVVYRKAVKTPKEIYEQLLKIDDYASPLVEDRKPTYDVART